jgi:hypothetical protein
MYFVIPHVRSTPEWLRSIIAYKGMYNGYILALPHRIIDDVEEEK